MPFRSIATSLIVTVLAGWLSMPSLRAAEMNVTADGRILVITGFIQEWDHCVAARLLAANPSIRQARINSPGGYAWTRAYLGRLFGWDGPHLWEAVFSGNGSGHPAEFIPKAWER